MGSFRSSAAGLRLHHLSVTTSRFACIPVSGGDSVLSHRSRHWRATVAKLHTTPSARYLRNTGILRTPYKDRVLYGTASNLLWVFVSLVSAVAPHQLTLPLMVTSGSGHTHYRRSTFVCECYVFSYINKYAAPILCELFWLHLFHHYKGDHSSAKYAQAG